MFNRVLFIIATIMALVLSTAAFAEQGKNKPNGNSSIIVTAKSPSPAQSQKILMKKDLQEFNGQNGKPAYIAVNGMVYDVTNVPAWKGGKHKGYRAGADLTEAIKHSPHGVKVLKGLPIVGKYIGK